MADNEEIDDLKVVFPMIMMETQTIGFN